jgi:transposase
VPASTNTGCATATGTGFREEPQEFGLSRPGWDEPMLVIHLKEHFGIRVKVRQAERIHKLGYSLKRASYTYVQARAEDAQKFGEELKKTERP